jgi:hypothetical protein
VIKYLFGVIDAQGNCPEGWLPWLEFQFAPTYLLMLDGWLFHSNWTWMMTAQERKDFRRVQTSRDIWKKRAVSRGEDRRRLRERRQEVERSREAWRGRALAAEDRIAQLELAKHQLQHAVTPASPPTAIDNTGFF